MLLIHLILHLSAEDVGLVLLGAKHLSWSHSGDTGVYDDFDIVSFYQ